VIAAVALVGASTTAAVLSPAPVNFGHLLPSVAEFVSTILGTGGLLLAALMYLRHRRTRQVSDLLLCAAFALFGLCRSTIPILASVAPSAATATLWVEIGGRFAVAIALSLAAWLPPRRLRRQMSPPTVVALTAGIAVAVIGYVIARGALHGPPPSIVASSPSGRPLQLASVVLLGAAATGFTARRVAASRDALAGWFAVTAILLGNAGVLEVFWPVVDPEWLTASDVLRVTATALLLVGVVQEVVLLWRQRIADAALEERKRVARELHDSVAQELAYLATSAMVVADGKDPGDPLRTLAASAERALLETRAAITALADDQVIPLHDVVAEVGQAVAARHGYEVVLDLTRVSVDERTGHELARVTGEAVENAARHGRPDRIEVQLRKSRRALQLRVVDDGRGIPAAGAGSAGFGLISMRERVEGLGGSCSVHPAPGGGTEVVVEVPRP
jgi:signal transduction histidine kinase